jgi:hypothetical protein
MFNFKNFGSNLKTQRSGVSQIDDDKSFFIGLINTYIACITRSDKLIEGFGITLMDYEEPYCQIIENMIYKHYGDWKCELILWYIYDRVSLDEEISPLILEDNGEEKQIILKTPDELWDVIIELENKIKKDE